MCAGGGGYVAAEVMTMISDVMVLAGADSTGIAVVVDCSMWRIFHP